MYSYLIHIYIYTYIDHVYKDMYVVCMKHIYI